MADVGTEFTDFLKAYSLEDFNKLSSDSVDDSLINALWSKHQSKFDAWKKCPEWLKSKYHNRIPDEILDKAKSDPNFTENDAKKADKEYLERNDPYTIVPKYVQENVVYPKLKEFDITITPTHIAAIKLLADQHIKTGYTRKTAEAVSAETVFVNAMFSKYAEISKDELLSSTEKAKKKQELSKLIDESRLRRLDIAQKDAHQNQPERMLMRTLRNLQSGRLDQTDALPQINSFATRIVETDRLDTLYEEMKKPLYQKVLKAETKEILGAYLQKYIAEPQQNTSIQQSKQTQQQNIPMFKLQQRYQGR